MAKNLETGTSGRAKRRVRSWAIAHARGAGQAHALTGYVKAALAEGALPGSSTGRGIQRVAVSGVKPMGV
jgi:hypothetical protein